MTEQKPFKPLTVAVLLIVFVMAALLGLYRWQATKSEPKKDTVNVGLEETVKRIAAHIVVNPKELPVMLMVTDPETMREANPWFYAQAMVGDRVLLWSDQAVLYRVNQDYILRVLPLNVPASTLKTLLDQGAPIPPVTGAVATMTTTTTGQISTLEIRNASGKAGQAKAASSKIDLDEFQIIKIGDAKKVQKTSLLVVRATIDPARVQFLMTLFGATTGTMPTGEAESTSDAVLFVGEK